MNISVILAHPGKQSFNHAIATATVDTLEHNGHELYFHDLYDERFDAILPFEEISNDARMPALIDTHCLEISAADGIIIIHPNWWGQPPAILKGWIDRVFRPGVAYKFLESDTGEGVPVGLLRAKLAIVFNTSNTGIKRENEVFGDPLESIWKNCIFDLCGVKQFYRRVFGIMVTSSDVQRKGWLSEVGETVNQHYPRKMP
jgi:NAD(P)H dehydrogenase (quinone)